MAGYTLQRIVISCTHLTPDMVFMGSSDAKPQTCVLFLTFIPARLRGVHRCGLQLALASSSKV